jgi:hypothetical protein
MLIENFRQTQALGKRQRLTSNKKVNAQMIFRKGIVVARDGNRCGRLAAPGVSTINNNMA